MQYLEVSGAVRPLKWPLGVKWLNKIVFWKVTSKINIINLRVVCKIIGTGQYEQNCAPHRYLCFMLISHILLFQSSFERAKIIRRRSQWPQIVRRKFAVTRLLRLWVRIPSVAWMSVYCECLVQVDFSATGRSLAQRSLTERVVCVCVCH